MIRENEAPAKPMISEGQGPGSRRANESTEQRKIKSKSKIKNEIKSKRMTKTRGSVTSSCQQTSYS
jgi:hypothetical protein